MALSIGELVGFITIDPSGVDDGINQAENQMRQAGQTIGNAAGAAGQTAGQQLGDGIVRGADGRLRNAQGQFVSAGHAAGDGFGDGLADGASDGADQAAEDAVSKMDKLKAGMAAAGVAAGAALMGAFGEAMEQGKITARLGVQLGATPAEAQKYGKIAGQLYSKGITEDFQTAADAIAATMGAGLLPPDATNAQIQSIATNVSDLASTFDQDLGGVTNAVSQMIRTGLAGSAKEALDILTAGFQSSANKADDLVDTFNEYGTQFRKAGLDGATAVGLMNQAIQAGARDSDIAADAIKEFSIRAIDGSDATADGFKALGLNADDMAKKFSEGGSSAAGALDTTLDRLRNIKDPIKQSAAATALFGTQAEDLGAALFAMDPSEAAEGLGKVGGKADEMGKQLRDNAGAKVESFKRTLQQGLVDMMGTYVIPALEAVPGYAQMVSDAIVSMAGFVEDNKGIFIGLASVITVVVLPSLVAWATTAYTTAAANVTAWLTSAASAVSTAATYVAVNAIIIAGWLSQGAAAVGAALKVVGAWVMMGLQAMIQAAKMAAAWFIALGPVGWVIATIVGLVALIIANWDTVKQWTAAAWDWIWTKIKGIAQFLVDLFMNWTLPGLIITHWDTIKGATQAAWDWIKNLVVTLVTDTVNLVMAAVGLLVTFVTSAWNTVKSVTTSIWNGIKAVISGAWTAIKTAVSTAVAGVKSVVSAGWNGIKSVTSSVWSAIKSTITGLLDSAKSFVMGAINSIKGFFSSGFGAAKQTVSDALTKVVGLIKDLPGKVKSAVAGAGKWLVNAGKSIIQGLIDGIKSMASSVGSAVKGVLSDARDLLPFSPAKKGPFSGKGWTLYSGRSMMTALAQGILQRKAAVAKAIASAAMQAKRHQIALTKVTTPYQTNQQVQYNDSGQEMAGVQNGMGGNMLNIEHYYESARNSARDTAEELSWLAKARG